MQVIKELYAYRTMIVSLVRRDLRGRYKGSALGFLWTFLNPLLQLGVYTFVFSIILPSSVDKFYMYLFIGLIPWLFFSSSLQDGTSCIITSKELVKKIYFPRLVLPISAVSASFVNMLFSMAIVFAALILSGIGISRYVFFLPVIMLLEYAFVLGIVLIFSAVNVYLRDMEHIVTILVMLWFYGTPIVYPISVIPERFLGLYYINPMTSIIEAYRDVLYYQKMPELINMIPVLIWGAVSTVLGCILFNKMQRGFAEEL